MMRKRLLLCILPALCFLHANLHAQTPPDDYDSLVSQALEQRNSGEFEVAERQLRQAQALAADTTEVRYLLAMVIAFQARYQEAMDILDNMLEQTPGDTNLQLARARVLSYQGMLVEAEQQVSRVLESEPGNQEALNLAGRIALYQQRPRLARERYRQAIVQDPADLETLIGLYDTEMAAGNEDDAEQWLISARDIAPTHIDVLSRSERHAPPGPRHQLSAGYEQSRFSRIPLQQWQDSHLAYRFIHNQNSEYLLRLDNKRRFDFEDRSIEAGAVLRRQSAVPLELSAGFTADADFSARYHIRAASSFIVSEGSARIGTTVLAPSIQYADYRSGNTLRFALGVEHYLRQINAWLTPGASLVRDENGNSSPGWQLGAHWQWHPQWRTGLQYSDAAETENTITTDTRSWYGYITWQPADRLRIQLDAGHHDRRGSYIRKTRGISLQYRF